MKKHDRIAIVLIVVVVGFGGTYLLFNEKKTATDANWRRDETLAGVDTIHRCLVANALDIGHSNMTDDELLGILIEKCRREIGRLKGFTFKSNRTILDPWGRPLRMKILDRGGQPGKLQISVWSIGRNGIDENGSGDDIVCSDK